MLLLLGALTYLQVLVSPEVLLLSAAQLGEMEVDDGCDGRIEDLGRASCPWIRPIGES